MLKQPAVYQGGKARIANDILDLIEPSGRFYDLCCGSGAMSLALVSRGFSPENITMVDIGLWGMFWESIAKNTFDLGVFQHCLSLLPDNDTKVKSYVLDIASAKADTPYMLYHFLILQSCSFGGKPIGLREKNEGCFWKHNGFKDLWVSKDGKLKRNPYSPEPKELYRRVKK